MRTSKTERSAESKKQLFNKKTRSPQDVIEERDSGHGYLNAHGDPAVEIFWGWNQAVEEDQIFKLRIKNKPGTHTTVYLDAEEVMRWLRWV